VIERYLELCLRLGRHVDGLVDAYYGPAEIKKRVDEEELHDPAALVQDAVSLRGQADHDWLGAQLLGLETVARKLAGEDVQYEDEVERCYGVRPEWVPEETFEAAHRELDEALPGNGSLAERYQVWREEDTLGGETLAEVYDSMLADVRERTRVLFGLPDAESVEVEYVCCEAGSPSTPRRCSLRTSSSSWRLTRPIPGITPSTPGRSRSRSSRAAASRSPRSWSARRRRSFPRGSLASRPRSCSATRSSKSWPGTSRTPV